MANEQRLEQLKQKYQSVLNAISQQGIRLAHLHVENDKLFLQGEAPSQDAKNRVWDQIKLVDPSYSDLSADITVNASAPPAEAPRTMGAGAGSAGHRTYTVRSGDSLSKIAKEQYGNAGEYMRIFEANRDKLSDPNKIQPGQELVIP